MLKKKNFIKLVKKKIFVFNIVNKLIQNILYKKTNFNYMLSNFTKINSNMIIKLKTNIKKKLKIIKFKIYNNLDNPKRYKSRILKKKLNVIKPEFNFFKALITNLKLYKFKYTHYINFFFFKKFISNIKLSKKTNKPNIKKNNFLIKFRRPTKKTKIVIRKSPFTLRTTNMNLLNFSFISVFNEKSIKFNFFFKSLTNVYS